MTLRSFRDRRRAEQPVQACGFLRTSKFSLPGSRL